MTGISDANISSESTRGKGDDKIYSAASHTGSTESADDKHLFVNYENDFESSRASSFLSTREGEL